MPFCWPNFVGVVKTGLDVSLGKNWRKKIFPEKKFVIVSGQWTEDFGFFSKTFQRSCRNVIGCIHSFFWLEKFLWKKYFWYQTRTTSENLLAFSRQSSGGLNPSSSNLSRGTFSGKGIIFLSFELFRFIFGDWRGSFHGRVKTAFYVSRETFWRKIKFEEANQLFQSLEEWANTFRPLVSFFDGYVRAAIYESIRTF